MADDRSPRRRRGRPPSRTPTSAPTSTTVPAHSWPGMTGKRTHRGSVKTPVIISMSVRHRPASRLSDEDVVGPHGRRLHLSVGDRVGSLDDDRLHAETILRAVSAIADLAAPLLVGLHRRPHRRARPPRPPPADAAARARPAARAACASPGRSIPILGRPHPGHDYDTSIRLVLEMLGSVPSGPCRRLPDQRPHLRAPRRALGHLAGVARLRGRGDRRRRARRRLHPARGLPGLRSLRDPAGLRPALGAPRARRRHDRRGRRPRRTRRLDRRGPRRPRDRAGRQVEEILGEAEEKVATESEIREAVRGGTLPLEAYERFGTFWRPRRRRRKVQGGVPIVEGRPAPETAIHDPTRSPSPPDLQCGARPTPRPRQMPSSRRAIAPCGPRATTRPWSRPGSCRSGRGSSRPPASLPGMRVLDVAAGTGNASLPAAQAGADVTASDLTPELLEAGRRRADAAGLTLAWVEADAEHLPFDDESFDVVISVDRRHVRAPPPADGERARARLPSGRHDRPAELDPGGHDRRAPADDRAVRAGAAARRAAPAAVGQRGAPDRALRRRRRLRHADARRPGGHRLRAPARLRRALQGPLRPDHRRSGQRTPQRARSGVRGGAGSLLRRMEPRHARRARASSSSTCSPSAPGPDRAAGRRRRPARRDPQDLHRRLDRPGPGVHLSDRARVGAGARLPRAGARARARRDGRELRRRRQPLGRWGGLEPGAVVLDLGCGAGTDLLDRRADDRPHRPRDRRRHDRRDARARA